MDGIAVVVNHENPVNGLTSEEVKAIYMGELDEWSEIPFDKEAIK
jgi:phosphate transport system substrate-binding protein